MRTGLSIYSLWNAWRKGLMTVEEEFAAMREMGCEATEIANFAVPLHKGPKGAEFKGPPDFEMAKRFVELSEQYQVPIGAYSCGSNIARVSREEYPVMLERLYAEIELARALKAPLIRIDLVTVMAGRDEVGVEAFDAMFPQAVEAARALADYAKQYDMWVTVENHGTFMNGADRVRKLIKAVDRENYGLTMDIGNTVCVDEDPMVLASELIDLAKEIHVKDFYIRNDPYAIGAKYVDGYTVADPSVLGNGSWLTTKHQRYLRGAIVGHGDLPMKDLISLIVRSGFDGDVLIEFEGMEEPVLASQISLNNLRQMIRMAEKK
ncbi:MAG: sugar phosphate isomerase/epimerase [Firmicutes bacterium]|nr:sugar phosphate isomerase/epimerase [Bacillota bacterium]